MWMDVMLAQANRAQEIGMYLLPLVGGTVLAYAIFNLVMDLRKNDSKRITDRLKERHAGGPDKQEKAVRDSLMRQQKGAGSAFGAAVANFSFTMHLQRMLDQANIGWAAGSVLINLAGLSAVGFIACHLLKLDLWIKIAVAIVIFVLPLLAIFIRRNMRMNKLMRQLPDVFDLMGQALRAGHSLANAILLVSQQLPDPIGTEFSRVFHEQNLGIKIEDALKSMAKRVGLMDVRFFVTAVLIQRQTGGDLAEVLDNISGVIRDRIKLFGTVKALTAEGRLSGWVLLALPIVVFMLELFINPTYANILLEEPVGQYMLISAGVAQLLGLAMIQKIVNIKV